MKNIVKKAVSDSVVVTLLIPVAVGVVAVNTALEAVTSVIRSGTIIAETLVGMNKSIDIMNN